MNFTKLVSLFAFVTLAVLSLGLASASFSFTGVTGANQTISASSQATISFTVDPSNPTAHSGTLFNATLLLPNLFGTGTSWSGNSASFTVLNTTSFLKTVSVQVPAGQAPGVYIGQISLTGDYVLPSGTSAAIPAVNNLTVQLTVPEPQASSNITISNVPTSAVLVNQNFTINVGLGSGALPLTGTVRISETTSPSTQTIFSPAEFSLTPGSTPQQVTVIPGLQGLKFGENTILFNAASGSQVTSSRFSIKKTFCSAGETQVSNLTIDEVSWDNNGNGGDEDNWELLDEIEVEVKVANDNQDRDVDAVVELGLFDSSGKNLADDLTFTEDSDGDDEQIDVTINNDDKETVKWVFKIPADFNTGDYRLAVKVYNDDRGESRDCKDSASEFDNGFYQPVTVEQTSDEGRFVVVEDIELESPLTCGQTVSGEYTVFNVGEDDEDRVKITLRNRDLNLEEIREITSDLDQGEDETLDFTLQIPATAQNGNYVLEFFTEYDYRNGIYKQESDDSFDFPIEVIGCSQNLGNSGGSLTNLEINAELSSEAEAGKELVVTATLKNTGTQDADYGLSARGYSSWAELVEISDSTVSIDAGESKEVTFTLMVNEDAVDAQTFDIQVTSSGRTQIQTVEVELAAASRASSLISVGNPIIWVIGIVNLILIILIIVVAVKLSRR